MSRLTLQASVARNPKLEQKCCASHLCYSLLSLWSLPNNSLCVEIDANFCLSLPYLLATL